MCEAYEAFCQLVLLSSASMSAQAGRLLRVRVTSAFCGCLSVRERVVSWQLEGELTCDVQTQSEIEKIELRELEETCRIQFPLFINLTAAFPRTPTWSYSKLHSRWLLRN